jgi:hypothetical protein
LTTERRVEATISVPETPTAGWRFTGREIGTVPAPGLDLGDRVVEARISDKLGVAAVEPSVRLIRHRPPPTRHPLDEVIE